MDLFDSTVIIDYLRGNSQAAEYINDILRKNLPILISVATHAELLIGAKNKKDQIRLEKTLIPFTPVPITKEISGLAIIIIKKYALSHGIHILDSFIAATAITQNYTLVTSNTKHFQMIKNLSLKPWPIENK